jgi:hypothetical protein
MNAHKSFGSSIAIAFVFTLSFWVSQNALAEQKQSLGDWDVHYMVLNSTFIQPSIARQYGLTRSDTLALVNISVLENRNQIVQQVSMQGTAKDLLGKVRQLDFKMIQEGDAVYYLAQFPFRNKDFYRFEIKIRQQNQMQTLRFQQEMYE